MYPPSWPGRKWICFGGVGQLQGEGANFGKLFGPQKILKKTAQFEPVANFRGGGGQCEFFFGP